LLIFICRQFTKLRLGFCLFAVYSSNEVEAAFALALPNAEKQQIQDLYGPVFIANPTKCPLVKMPFEQTQKYSRPVKHHENEVRVDD